MKKHPGLADLLATGRGGVRPLPADTADELLKASAQLGFAGARADLAACADKPGLLRAIADALRFPEWFGCNWDALADCLGDLSWLPATGYVLILEHTERVRRSTPEDFRTALEILDDAAELRSSPDEAPLWVFVDLPSHEVERPS